MVDPNRLPWLHSYAIGVDRSLVRSIPFDTEGDRQGFHQQQSFFFSRHFSTSPSRDESVVSKGSTHPSRHAVHALQFGVKDWIMTETPTPHQLPPSGFQPWKLDTYQEKK